MTLTCLSSAAAAQALLRQLKLITRAQRRHDRYQAAHRRRQHDDGGRRNSGGRQAQRFSRACIILTPSAADTLPAKPRTSLQNLLCEAPEAIQWLNDLGVEFDKAPDGTMITTHGGGTSRKRMHAAKDYSGAEIMRTLRDEVLNRGIPVVDFTAAIELILDEKGKAAGAVLMNMETKEIMVARAKTVIIATGGAGRLHYQGFPTSNHYGATADGLVLGLPRRRKAALCRHASVSSRRARPIPRADFRRTRDRKGTFARRKACQLVNGEVFMHPLETRDVSAASIIRECSDQRQGRCTPAAAMARVA